MTNASSSKNKALFLAFLMAVTIPSAALATEEDFPDAILTVSVNMGSNDAGDGEGGSGCTGFSTMGLSATQLQSRVERVTPGVANPTIQQRLAALRTPELFGVSLGANDTVLVSDNGASVTARVFTRSEIVSGSWIIRPEWINQWDGEWDGDERLEALKIISELTQQDLTRYVLNDPFWTDEVLSFSPETPSLASVDRRTYITSPFTVSYDASSCLSDSDSEARITIERTPLEASSTVNSIARWSSVETDWEAGFSSLSSFLAAASEGGYRGDSHLLQQTRPGGDSEGERGSWKVAPVPLAADTDWWDSRWNDDISGEAGDIGMFGVTNLSGELSQNAQFRTTYMFWMEIDPSGDWDW